jgi:hypothetical protein
MSGGRRAKLQEAVDTCTWHAAILHEDLAEHGDYRYDAQSVEHLGRGEYPDQPEIRAAVLNRFLQDVEKLLAFWSQIERSYRLLAT